jgi:hypothetical protein
MYILNGAAYDFFGGIAPNQYKGSGFFAAITGVSSTSVSFGSWSTTAVDLPNSAVLGRFGLAHESAHFYVVGGTSNDTDALRATYRILH